MGSKAMAVTSVFLFLAGFQKDDQQKAGIEKLAEVTCARGSEEQRLTLGKQVLREPEESSLSSRLVVLTVDRYSGHESVEPRPVWRDLAAYLSGVFPRPDWSADMLCGRRPGQAWLIVAITNGTRFELNGYMFDIIPTSDKNFPDPEAYVGKHIREEERTRPLARWTGELPGGSCGIRSVEAAWSGDDILVVLYRHEDSCGALRMRLDTRTSRFEQVNLPTEKKTDSRGR